MLYVLDLSSKEVSIQRGRRRLLAAGQQSRAEERRMRVQRDWGPTTGSRRGGGIAASRRGQGAPGMLFRRQTAEATASPAPVASALHSRLCSRVELGEGSPGHLADTVSTLPACTVTAQRPSPEHAAPEATRSPATLRTDGYVSSRTVTVTNLRRRAKC
ncbi:hypothetical protein CB1_000218002 [Camelus ferus]|nr:hypothetical protein CB1_000218002 [Camelus ferus]